MAIDMLNGEKILITGPAGQIAFPMTQYLARDNEVWGIARFSEAGSRERVDALGVTTRVVDLAKGDYSDVPDDFTCILHLATFQAANADYDYALRVNAEGTGRLLSHTRKARAALVMSTFSVYSRNDDPYHAFAETDPLGDARSVHAPTYTVSKIGEEAVARTAARAFDLPVVIARMNAAYGPNGGLPGYQLDWMMADQPITLRAPGPTPYSPIHQDDINAQVEAFLSVASVPGAIVNWAGDEVVTAEEWCGYLAELAGKEPRYEHVEHPAASRGTASDNTRRRSLIGPCRVSWRDGMRDMFEARYPNGVASGELAAEAARLREAVSTGSGDRDG
jgi:nucleoside-diphosphate-sugar epimerase